MTASEILSKVVSELSRQPARTVSIVLTSPLTVSRRSKGKSDRAQVGAVISTDKGWAIIAKDLGKERDYRDEWVIRMEGRPPTTDTEMLAVARAMYARWAEQSLFRSVGSPDDERDRAAWDAAGQLNREIGRTVSDLLT
jgi:hypothetical protein